MVNQRWRPVFFSAVAVVVIWIIATAGYLIAKNSKVTAEKVRTYVQSVDLSKLSAAERARAIADLAAKLNALSIEERRRARLEQGAWRWMAQMTEEEKSKFIEATMPTGFKQMLSAFEQLPEEKRRKTIEDAVKRLKDAQLKLQGESGSWDATNTNRPPPLSPELQAQIRQIGLKAFYSQSSAQSKAELAPVLEELQRVMESGRPFRTR